MGTEKLKQPSKKLVVMAVVGLLTLVIVVVSVLVGVYLFTDAFHRITRESTQTGKNTVQDTTVDLTANVVDYKVNGEGLEAQIVEDYNSLLMTLKYSQSDLCLITPLNISERVDLTKFTLADMKSFDTTENIVLVRSKMKIPDVSFMNKRARNVCQGIPAYWAYKSCIGDPSANLVRRQLSYCRKICISGVCRKVCISVG